MDCCDCKLFVLVALFSPLLSRLQWWFRDKKSPNIYSTIHYVKDLTVIIISFLFTVLIYFINENQKKVTENQDLMIENIRNQYNALEKSNRSTFCF